MKAIADDVASGNTWGGQINLVHSSGQTIAADCDAAPTLDSDGDCVGAVLSFADITDTIRAQEAERTIERNRVMMESIGSVCHHLGQPSTVILNSLEMLQRLDESDAEERKELLQMSLDAAEQIGDLLRELNDLRTYRSEAYANTDSIVSIAAKQQEPTEGRVDDEGYVR
jgi:signal transduction histidine kinase